MATSPKAAAKTKTPAKAAAEKPAAKTAAPAKTKKAKTITPPAPGDKPNALQKPLTPSPELAEIVGKGMLPRAR